MKPTSIRVSLSEKINIGGYETIEPGFHIEATLEDGDDPVECRRELYALASTAVKDIAVELLKEAVSRRSAATKPDVDLIEYTKSLVRSLR